jgi:hypothetical protein
MIDWKEFLDTPVVVVEVSDETDSPSYQVVKHSFGTPTTMKLSITRDLVGRFARALVTLNGSTTTLDVKNALREQGFFAKQDQVSAYLNDISINDGDLSYVDNNGRYRVYTFTVPDPNTNVPSDYQNVKKTLADFKAAVRKSGITVISQRQGLRPNTTATTPLHRDNIPARYTVTDRFDGNLRTYNNITRGQAKSRWARETGLPLFEARTQKVVN